MVDLLKKGSILDELHNTLYDAVEVVARSRATPQEKSKRVNALVTTERDRLIESISTLKIKQRGMAALLVQYCVSVTYLEYRHRVWPYEYMTFSRRVGELWEAFCSTAWTYPVNPDVVRVAAPDFCDVGTALVDRIQKNLGSHPKRKRIMDDVSVLYEFAGDINMRADEVFTKAGVPHVIDFKSGFGSNEKGNMQRLLTVGRAYKIWNPDTRLMLLVRQDQNNNYLDVLRRSNLWEVYTGRASYKKIREITGADIESVRKEIDWRADLSRKFHSYLEGQPTDLTVYLAW